MAFDRTESYINFIDTLFSIVVGFMLIQFRIFMISVINEGFTILKYILPFILLYLLYMIKLALYWYEAKSDFQIMSYYYSVNITRGHYVGMIASAFLMAQLISSLIVEGSIKETKLESAFLLFILWLIMSNILGDAIPTLTIIRKKSKESFSKVDKKAKYLRNHKIYFLKILKFNAFINIIIPFAALILMYFLDKTNLNYLFIIYIIALMLLTLNILQEIFLLRARRELLSISLEEII